MPERDQQRVAQFVENVMRVRTCVCPYCGETAAKVSGIELYPNHPDLARRSYYICWPCRAWVSCHWKTGEPMGSLANEELRALRRTAHAAFDPLWQSPGLPDRAQAYRWLALELKIPPQLCHIAMFNREECLAVLELCMSRL